MRHLQLGACISGSLVPALHTDGDGVTARQMLRSRRRSQPARLQNTPTLPGRPQNGQQIPWQQLNMYQQYMLQQQQQLMQKQWMQQQLLAQKTKTQRQVCIPSTGETYWACDNGVPQRFNVTLSRQVTPLMHEGDCALARATPHVSAPIDSPSKTTPAHKGSTTKHQEAEETVIREPHVATIMRECSLLISDCTVDSLDSYYMGGLSDPSAQHPTATCNNDECHDDILPYENGIPTDFSRDFAYLEDLADISCVATSNEPSC